MCLAIIGGIVSAVGTLASASASAASSRAQARMAERQAQIESEAGAYESARVADQNTRQLDRMRSQYLSSGIAVEGSAADVIADSATEASLDEQAIRYGAKIREDNYRFEGQMARMNANQAMIGGVIGAVGSVIGGFSQQKQQNASRTMVRNPYGGGF